MADFLVVVLVAALVVAVIVLIRSLRRERARDDTVVDPLRRDARGIDPRRLKVGDVVHHEGRDYIVRGTLAFDEEGFRWQEHLLDDASGRRWLSVEDDEELELVLWDRVTASDLVPGAPKLSYGGVDYELEEHGTASYTATGATGTAPSGTAAYYDYVSATHRLSFERFSGDSWEVSVGEPVNERSLDIYPSAEA